MLLSNGLCRIFIDIIFLRQLKAKKFHDVISFLQQPPSVSWKTTEVCKNAVNCPEGTDWQIIKKCCPGGSCVSRSISVAVTTILTLVSDC